MATQTQITRQFIRATILAALVALLALTTVQRAGAQQTDQTSYDNSLGQIALCELAGGTAEVDHYQTGGGFYATTVICHGGLLDGMVCINNPSGTACSIAWFTPEVDDDAVAPIDEIEIAPEPIDSPQIDDGAVEIEPSIDLGMGDADIAGEFGEPAPDPTAEPIVDETVIVEEVAPPLDESDDAGGRDLPVVNDAVVINEVIEPGSSDGSGKGDLPVIVDTIDLTGAGS